MLSETEKNQYESIAYDYKYITYGELFQTLPLHVVAYRQYISESTTGKISKINPKKEFPEIFSKYEKLSKKDSEKEIFDPGKEIKAIYSISETERLASYIVETNTEYPATFRKYFSDIIKERKKTSDRHYVFLFVTTYNKQKKLKCMNQYQK